MNTTENTTITTYTFQVTLVNPRHRHFGQRTTTETVMTWRSEAEARHQAEVSAILDANKTVSGWIVAR